MNVKRSNILFSLLVLLCLESFGCGKTILFSAWRDRAIKIDGKYTDWSESTAYYDEDAKVVLNLVNDADYLYICLISKNRAIETKIMESGLTIWLDPDGGQKKVFGIRFPIGLKRMGMSIDDEEKRDITRDWQNQEDKSGLIDREKERLTDKNFNKRLETLEGLQEKLEILKGDFGLEGKNKRTGHFAKKVNKRGITKDKDIAPEDNKKNKPIELSSEEAGKFGIEAKVGRENDYFVYELKVPLIKTSEHIYAIEAKKGEPIGLGVEAENAAMFGNGMGDRMPSREGRMSQGGMFGSESKLKLWLTVALSSEA